MRILFVMRNHGYLRNYASTIRLLADRGHEVVVGSRGRERHMQVDTESYLVALSRECPRITAMELPRRKDRWQPLASGVRAVRNALRYRHPALRGAESLVQRAHAHLSKQAPRVAARGLPRSWLAASALSSMAGIVESAIPTDPTIDAVLAAVAPDAVVVTPLVDFVSYQVDYVKSANRRGIPVALAVASWDNLTNKGIINVQPDCVIVWNEAQKREAVELHNIPADRIRITGAQLFDEWFERTPSTTRTEFCARVGVDPDRPFVLYLCSSLFIARDEVSFVRSWLERLRASTYGPLRDCGVLVRPYPSHAAQWADVDLSSFGNVSIWPRAGDMPLFEASKAGYYDSIHHAAAVVAINTTGFIEAGIVGRTSFTILAPEFAATQEGTVHFAHLTAPGFLKTARTFDEHEAQLDAEIRHPSTRDSLESFVRHFVRPFGLESPATPRVAAAIEELGAMRVSPARRTLAARILRPVLNRLINERKREPVQRHGQDDQEKAPSTRDGQVESPRRRIARM